MKTTQAFLLGCGLAALLASCAVEAVNEPVNEAATTAALEAAASKAPADVGTSTMVWNYLGTESCFDFFLRPCTDGLPNNQFPGIGPGVACPESGLWGNKRIAGNSYFEQYICW